MAISDKDFFHQATLRICSSLNIEQVILDCYDYLKNFMPLDAVLLNMFDSESGTIRNITMVSGLDNSKIVAPVIIPEKIKQALLAIKDKTMIVPQADKHPIGRLYKPYLGMDKYSTLVLRLIIDGKILGSLNLVAHGNDRYTEEHFHIASLLNDPMCLALSNTLKHQEILKLKEILADDNRFLKREISQMRGDEIIGADFGLRDVMEMVKQVAPLSSQVLILGETGVGKEIIANAVHFSSPRRDNPFIKVNCGAISENLIDSELFGHEKGAFTGAISKKRGRFERAHQGTIFLDEIGELPPQAQVRLLRVIQNHEIERVGGEKPVSVDIRIIAATHRNLEEMVHKGKFREDLWFRLNVFPIVVPPLRLRKSDIPALVNHFIERKSRELNLGHHPTKSPKSIKILQNYHWPGNVRELENLVERELIKNRTAEPDTPLSFEGLLPANVEQASETVDDKRDKDKPDSLNLDDANRRFIQNALQMTNGKVQGKKGAARLLGINPNTLRNRMKKLGISYGRKAN